MMMGIAAAYFISDRLQPFDPNKLLTAKNSTALLNEISLLSEFKNTQFKKVIIHITSENCSCTQFSEEHKKSINETALKAGFAIVNITLPEKLNSIIPSTPAILMLDEMSELLYFGPYSAGLACTESNGYIETVLNNYNMGFSSNLMINDVNGCYCNL